MTALSPVIMEVPLARVSDGNYYPAVLGLLRASTHRCCCSLFIVDHFLEGDPAARVDTVLTELASAHWRGIEVRLLIGGSRTNARIEKASLMADARARQLGIETRLASARKGLSSHVKLVIADDWVLTGSHNWSRAMFGAETQDSVLLRQPAVAASLGAYFDHQWAKAGTGAYDVSF
jgi:phosphatidylserine/phosphatidylglycerophosphate/cardiolipin synthase-like enzyme